MTGLDALPPLRDVVRRHGLAAKRTLGQNFLFDLNLTSRIARAAGPLENATIVEVGAGPGGLTRALLAGGAAQVIAVERDARCLAPLNEIAAHYPGRLTIVEDDALAVDFPNLVRGSEHPVRVCANLPYNIGTALLVRWIEEDVWPPWYERLTLMFQREVAERIVASPAQRKDYGRLAVLCGWRSQARILFDVPATAFVPAPKVTSSVVELVPRTAPAPCNLRLLSAVAQAAFGQRRKMLRQALRTVAAGAWRIDAITLLNRAAIPPTLRAEDVDVDGFVRLACALEAMIAQI